MKKLINIRYLGTYFFLTALVLATVSLLVWPGPVVAPGPETAYLILDGQKVDLEVARSSAERSRGLSGRENLKIDSGMLFVFQQANYYPFWMKGMLFPLDYIFFNGDRVVDLVENVPPPQAGEKPRDVSSGYKFDKALEVNAGMIEKWEVKVGDKVEFFLD